MTFDNQHHGSLTAYKSNNLFVDWCKLGNTNAVLMESAERVYGQTENKTGELIANKVDSCTCTLSVVN